VIVFDGEVSGKQAPASTLERLKDGNPMDLR